MTIYTYFSLLIFAVFITVLTSYIFLESPGRFPTLGEDFWRDLVAGLPFETPYSSSHGSEDRGSYYSLYDGGYDCK